MVAIILQILFIWFSFLHLKPVKALEEVIM